MNTSIALAINTIKKGTDMLKLNDETVLTIEAIGNSVQWTTASGTHTLVLGDVFNPLDLMNMCAPVSVFFHGELVTHKELYAALYELAEGCIETTAYNETVTLDELYSEECDVYEKLAETVQDQEYELELMIRASAVYHDLDLVKIQRLIERLRARLYNSDTKLRESRNRLSAINDKMRRSDHVPSAQ